MLIPIAVDRPRKRPTVITYWLIGICIVVSLIQVVLNRFAPGTHDLLFHTDTQGAKSLLMLGWPPVHEFEFWQVVTYQFLHAGPMHLFGNMLFLFVFGPPVEDRVGRIGFLTLYLVGGIAAGATHLVIEGDMLAGQYIVSPVVGASGSVAAITGAFLMLFPGTGIRVLLFFFIIGVYTIPAWWMILFAVLKDLIFAGGNSGVAHAAHLGGYAFGFGAAYALLATKVISREPYDLFTIGRQAKRRRQFRELTTKPMSDRVWDTPRGTKDGKDAPKPKRVSARGEAEMKARGAVAQAIEAGNLDEAGRRYLKLVDEFGEQCLSRDGQLAVANHLHASGDHQHAALAYRQFTDRYRADSETNRVRLMHAVLLARYLNDPIGAERELDAIENHKLSSDEAELASTLREELA